MVKVALTSRVPSFSVEELFAFAKDAKFDGIEYVAYMKDLYRSPGHVNGYSQEYQMPIISLHLPPPLVVVTPKFLFKKMTSLVRHFPDVSIINHHLSGLINTYFVHVKFLKHFLNHAKKQGVLMTFESNPKSPTTFGFHPLVTREPKLFGDFCIANNLPITLDTSHIADNHYDIVKFFTDYHKHIKLIHLSDYKNHEQHLALGEGELPLKELFHEIKKTEWKGIITLEVCKFPGIHTKEKKLEAIRNSFLMVKKFL